MEYNIPESKWIWIGQDYDKERPLVVYFRKEWELSEVPEKAVVRLSADSRYRFYVNGTSLCQGPCKGDRQVWYYDEVDIAPFLHTGKNVLAAVVLRYPLLHSNGNFSVWRTETPGFYLEGETIGVCTGRDWRWCLAEQIQIGKSNPYFEPLCITEEASGVAMLADWMLPDYQEISKKGSQFGWQEAVPYPGMGEYVSPGRLNPRPIPFLYEKTCSFQEVMCVREGKGTKELWENWLRQDKQMLLIPAKSKEVVELHVGELTTGYLELAVAGGAGSRIRISCSESYVKQPELPPEVMSVGKSEVLEKELQEKIAQVISFMKPEKGDRLDWQGGMLAGPTDRYTVGGYGTKEKPERYEPFWFRTFRFIKLEIETGEEPLELCALRYRETGYPLEVKTKVETSDKSLSGIWDICERTLRRCMHETYEDCPFYEQLQYIMDTRSQILFTYMVSADDRLARKCIEDFARSQRYDGLLEGCYPSFGSNLICNFSIYYILMVRDQYLYFGDAAFTIRFLPVLERILQFFGSRLNEKGLVRRTSEGGQDGRYWSFIDWVDGWERGVPSAIQSGDVTMESLLYCIGLQALADLERYFAEEGYLGLAERHEREAETLKQSIRRVCMDERGLLTDGPGLAVYSQHCQVFGTLAGVFTPEEARQAMETAIEDASFAPCSVAMAYYLFRALEQADLYEKTDLLWENWRSMLRANLTTCVESEGIQGRSDCHAWGALALYELPAVVLGVRPLKPGFAEIEIRPVPGYLSWAKGEVVTPKGTIYVEWNKKEDGSLKVKANVPPECQVKGRQG